MARERTIAYYARMELQVRACLAGRPLSVQEGTNRLPSGWTAPPFIAAVPVAKPYDRFGPAAVVVAGRERAMVVVDD